MVAMASIQDSLHIQDLKSKFAVINKRIQDSLESADKKMDNIEANSKKISLEMIHLELQITKSKNPTYPMY